MIVEEHHGREVKMGWEDDVRGKQADISPTRSCRQLGLSVLVDSAARVFIGGFGAVWRRMFVRHPTVLASHDTCHINNVSLSTVITTY